MNLRSTFPHFFPHCYSLVKKAIDCQVSKLKKKALGTGYKTSKIKACEEVDEIVDFCGRQSQKEGQKYICWCVFVEYYQQLRWKW